MNFISSDWKSQKTNSGAVYKYRWNPEWNPNVMDMNKTLDADISISRNLAAKNLYSLFKYMSKRYVVFQKTKKNAIGRCQ